MKIENVPFVSVICTAYNQENYIIDALEGFVNQKTNFPFEIIVHDDASTDKTASLIREFEIKYPNLFVTIYQNENQYSKKNGDVGKIVFGFARGKYVALCEGDDYWTDPLKLQKQVDFLEANPDYSICWTKYFIKNESDMLSSLQEPDWVRRLDIKDNITIDLNSIFTPYCTYTLTVLFRRESLDYSLFKSLKYGKDNSLYTICLGKGKGMLMNFYSSIYRMHDGGVYSNASEFKQKYYSYLNLKEIVNKVPLCDNLNIRNIRNHLLSESIKLHPNILSIGYINLVLDSIKFLGLKKSIKLVLKKISIANSGK
nr:glycosyltransferase [uncultured Flavobacterium sp.]